MENQTAEPQTGVSANAALASLLDITYDFLYAGSDLDSLLNRIVKAVSETFGLKVSTIGIIDKETGLYCVRASYGFDPETTKKILQVKYTKERMAEDLKPEFKIGRNTYYVPQEGWVPEEEDWLFIAHPELANVPRASPTEWHACDFIDFLMYEKDGTLLGYLEIEEPLDGKVPDDEKLRAIEGFSDLAAIAIQNAKLYEQIQEDRKKVEILLDLIGHDINNYTQAVSGFIELGLSRKGVPEPTRKSMVKALDQLWNLTKLVSNVKLYGKVETSGDRDLRPMDLVGTIKEAFSEARDFTPNRQVRMALHDDEEKKMSVMNSLAKDVFLNLFTNAIKFDPHESVVIEVSVEEKVEEKRPMWIVSVADRGPGVADDMKEAIFKRFWKGGDPRSSSGLGLHIAKTLVVIYKGRIWVEDRVPGDHSKGSVFKVALPKCEKNA
ncbi:MAG: hypothetical protein A3K60_05115 [Euryarchaeota archaeon RBG_19FT_COMBO_56_21]|nr:MAG: hypothetical protein A3K60_05115 [Euryarchaeota archaeon RBG_19FT_COMBO_56_21]